jgi:TolA-binding protein
MRPFHLATLVLFCCAPIPSTCYSQATGGLFWETADQVVSEKTTEKLLLYPDAPLGGKAPKDALLVGIIDSGVNHDHPQISGFLKSERDFTGEGERDVIGHGTVVTLIALYGQEPRTPAFGLVSAKVVDHEGTIQKKAVLEAIDWVVGEKVKIVNMSLGFKGDLSEHRDLCEAISKHGEVLFVAAAGNYGPEVRVFPAACEAPNLLSVEASDADGNLAEYSGRGEIRASGEVGLEEAWYYHYQAALTHSKAGRYDDARRLYGQSIKAEPNPESEYQIGLIDLAETKYEAALVRFRTAIKLNPSIAEAHEMLGATYFLEKNYSKAEPPLRNAIDLYPDTPNTLAYRARAHFNLGQVLAKLNRNVEAQEEFQFVQHLVPAYPGIDSAIRAVKPSVTP